jgi:signal transduction histidine kinase
MAAAERERFLTNLTQDTERLAQLVHRLLELAHADMLSVSSATCRVGDVVGQLAARCAAIASP